MPTPIPPTLSFFAKPPVPGSLTLVTSVLDATSNWLLLRYIYAALRPEKPDGHDAKAARVTAATEEATPDDKDEELKVILVSFLRPFELWKEMAKKIGLDLPSLLSPPNPRLIYIDAFSHLSFPPNTPTPPLPQRSHPKIHILPPLTTLAALESHLLPLLPTRPPPHEHSNQEATHILALDSLDLLLASSPTSASITPLTLTSLLLTLRSRSAIHSTILTLSADAPLLHNGGAGGDGPTPLELSHREFVTSTAHQAERVVQLRGLDTGAASDVSGVLRLSKGGAAAGRLLEEGEGSEKIREASEEGGGGEGEWLYQVRGNGSVRVWARGE